MKRFVKVEIEAEDGIETFCDDKCFWLLKGGLNCRLFDVNLQPHENGRKRERCPDCLMQDIGKA